MKRAFVRVSYPFLKSFLLLPDSTRIETVISGIMDFRVLVSGNRLPDFTKVKDGDKIKEITLIYKKGPCCPTCGKGDTKLEEIKEVD